MKDHSRSGVDRFDSWFRIPSPGYTIFLVMPETWLDPFTFISSWIMENTREADLVVLSTRSTIDGLLEMLSHIDPSCSTHLASMDSRLHFVDCYSSRLDLFGLPSRHRDADIRYVVNPREHMGAGTVLGVMRELRTQGGPRGFLALEYSLSDIAVDLGEAGHVPVFSEMVLNSRSRRGTVIGIADWYSHREIYKARLIQISDASLLWGISSGDRKTKYILPIKRGRVNPAKRFEPKPYSISGSDLFFSTSATVPIQTPLAQEDCYR